MWPHKTITVPVIMEALVMIKKETDKDINNVSGKMFGLISWLNGISTLVEYLMQSYLCRRVRVLLFKPYLVWGNKAVHAFLKVISLKVYIIVRMEFGLFYFKAEVQSLRPEDFPHKTQNKWQKHKYLECI